MAEENIEWNTSPAVLNETVLAVKRFLDAELAKYETWKMANKFISHLFDNAKSFSNAKRDGIGQTTILKFLGGNWKQWMVQQVLDTLKDDAIDRAAGRIAGSRLNRLVVTCCHYLQTKYCDKW